MVFPLPLDSKFLVIDPKCASQRNSLDRLCRSGRMSFIVLKFRDSENCTTSYSRKGMIERTALILLRNHRKLPERYIHITGCSHWLYFVFNGTFLI